MNLPDDFNLIFNSFFSEAAYQSIKQNKNQILGVTQTELLMELLT